MRPQHPSGRDLGEVAQELEPRVVGNRVIRVAASVEDQRVLGQRGPDQLGHEPRLPDSRLARDDHELGFAGGSVIPTPRQDPQLVAAPHEGRLGYAAKAGGKRGSRALRTRLPEHLPGEHPFRQALQHEPAGRLELLRRVPAQHHPQRIWDEDLASTGRGAQAGRLDRGDPEIVAGLDRGVADADPDPHAHADLGAAVAQLQLLLDAHGAGDRPGDAREGDHEPVAGVLHDASVEILGRVAKDRVVLLAKLVEPRPAER